MRDYAKLIKALRFAFDQPCYSCVLGEKCNWGDFCFFKRSADAIEELLKENDELENSGRVLMATFARAKEKMPHWISVEERLPGKDDTVFFCYEWTGQSGTVYKEVSLSTLGEIRHFGFKLIAWMPLPKPPKESP